MNTLQLRILLAGSLARLATEGAGLAIVVLSIDRTGSATMAGVLLACATLPQLVTGPLVGAALDRSRRPGLILAGAVAASAAAVGALAVDRSLGPVAVAAALATSVTQPVLTGGLSASFARLAARPSDAARIASWDAVAYNVAGLGGPALVTGLAAWWGATVATGALAVAIAAALPAVCGPWPVPAEDRRRTTRATLLAAVRLMATRPPLRSVTAATSVAFVGVGGLAIAAAAAGRSTGGAGTDAGVVVTAIAVGALAGSLLWTRRRPAARPARDVALATAATGVVLVAMGLMPWPVAVVGAVMVGVLDAPVLVGTFATRHAESPLELRSSVFTVGASLKLAASSLGALAAGSLLGTAVTGAGFVAIGAIHVVGAVLGVVAGRGRADEMPERRGRLGRRRGSLGEAVVVGVGGSGAARRDADLREDVAEVAGDGLLADDQLLSDSAVGRAPSDEP